MTKILRDHVLNSHTLGDVASSARLVLLLLFGRESRDLGLFKTSLWLDAMERLPPSDIRLPQRS